MLLKFVQPTSLSPKSNLQYFSFKTFYKGEEENQFLKDSAQDLKKRRNKNKVGLLPNPFPLLEISMLNLFSFQGQKFGHKRHGASGQG